jgi:DNA-binding MarR family transcriptional regulator
MSNAKRPKHGGDNLSYLIRRAQLASRAAMDAGLKPLGVTAPQYAVLASLSIEPGISNAALARVAFVTAQSMLGIVANLEKLGLIEREADPAHGRILQTRLTDEGKAIVARAHRIARSVEETMTHNVAERDVVQLKRLLVKFAENLGG